MKPPLALAVLALVSACSQSSRLTQPVTTTKPPLGGSTQIMMSFARAGTFYDAPFPSDDLRRADGTIDLSRFPNPNAAALMTQALALASPTGGFGRSSGVFFQATGALDATTLPDVPGSVAAGASVFILGIDPAAPDYLKRYPVEAHFDADGGPFGVANLVALIPVQGTPLRGSTAYAAVVTTAVKDASGAPLAASSVVSALAAGTAPSGVSAAAATSYQSAMKALAKAGLDPSKIAGLTAFTTGDPVAQAATFRDDMLARPLPAPDAPFKQTDLFPEFCVYQSTIGLPDYQAGTPPFSNDGGGWTTDASGKPALQRTEEAKIVVSVPRKAIPAAGFPSTIFVRTGGGGDRPLVDRGPQGVTNGPPLAPGTGPALYLARAGFAGVSFDGPLGGLRNTTNANEDFTIFNVFNALALRDNIRESAIELVLEAHILPTLSFDVSDCPGALSASGGTKVSFDVSHLTLMGHSMGATIAPLAVALEPSFKNVVLSGAGGSWIENVVYKQLPLNVKPAIEFLLQYATNQGQQITTYDPALSMFQWAIESADPQVYDERVVLAPPSGAPARNVLMFQGIVDHYILPDIANTTTLSIGLDLAGQELDQSPDEPAGQTLVSSLLPLAGRSAIGYPASGNLSGPDGSKATGVVVQAPGDGIEDGHEVMFQTDTPKHQYQCFLQSSLTGTPSVPAPASSDAGCP